MSPWKVILATLVIFIAGLGTGVLLEKHRGTSSLPETPPGLPTQRLDLIGRMNQQLDLTPAQRESIEQILRESRDRIRKLREIVEPKVKEETRLVRERIRQVLTPMQIRKFDKLMEQRPRSRSPELNPKGSRTQDRVAEPSPADEAPSTPEP